MTRSAAAIREDFRAIANMVADGSKVLDVGCGSGELLQLLRDEKCVDGRGLEISSDGVSACLAKGLAVIQGDADRDLADYPPLRFDYAILSQTLQATHAPKEVLTHLLRLAERAIVSVPNFAHWRVRGSLMWSGRMPETRALPVAWYETPNIHLCTLRDFTDLCAELGVEIEASAALYSDRPARPMNAMGPFENLRAEAALFLLRKGR